MKKILFVITFAALCGCAKQETDMQRWEREARAAIPQECSNEVAGIQHIISSDLVKITQVPGSWSGRAVVDYGNQIGGIDRTNLWIAFRVAGDHIYALPDFDAYHRSEKARYDAELKILTNRANAALAHLSEVLHPAEANKTAEETHYDWPIDPETGMQIEPKLYTAKYHKPWGPKK